MLAFEEKKKSPATIKVIGVGGGGMRLGGQAEGTTGQDGGDGGEEGHGPTAPRAVARCVAGPCWSAGGAAGRVAGLRSDGTIGPTTAIQVHDDFLVNEGIGGRGSQRRTQAR